MNNQTDHLPEDLSKAARNLEERFHALGVPVWKASQAQWDAVPEEIRRKVPAWIPALLSNYALLGGGLEFRHWHESYTWPAEFGFFGPENFTTDLVDGEYGELLRYGYFPFASHLENLWVCTLAHGASGNIYYLEHSSWDGGEPTPKNGLVFACSRLSLLLLGMAVGDAEKIVSPIWNEVREVR